MPLRGICGGRHLLKSAIYLSFLGVSTAATFKRPSPALYKSFEKIRACRAEVPLKGTQGAPHFWACIRAILLQARKRRTTRKKRTATVSSRAIFQRAGNTEIEQQTSRLALFFSGTKNACPIFGYASAVRDGMPSPGQLAQKVVVTEHRHRHAPLSAEGRFSISAL